MMNEQQMKSVPRKAFKITDGHGFHIHFASGFTVSVQFGPGNYGDNYDMEIGRDDHAAGKRGSNKAEVAIFGGDGLIELPHGDTVDAYLTPASVLHYINAAATSDPAAYLREHLPAKAEA